mgnify:CR=1 FL=1
MSSYTIRRYKNYGIISPVPDGKLAATLSRYMSYERQNSQFIPNPMFRVVRLYNAKKGTFPWGFRKLVQKIFKTYCQDINSEDNYNIINTSKNITYNYIETDDLRPYQWKAVKSLIENNGGIISIPTGGGKTRTVLKWLNILDLPAVVIVTTLDIKEQWQKQITSDKIKVINWQSKLVDRYIEESKIVFYDECHHLGAKYIFKTAMKIDTHTIIGGCSATI